MNYEGCFTAIVTPFKNGTIDYPAFEKLIEMQIEGNVAGIVAVGTTGESPTLNQEEHLRVIDFTIQKVNKRCAVIAGAGANSTEEAIYLTKKAKEYGADASLQVTPYYNKPSQEGLFRHFSAIADAVELEIILYNVPGRAGKEIELDTVVRLAEHANITCIKEAGGSVDRVSQILNACDIVVLSGDDPLTLPMMSVGAKGVISVLSNILPTEISALVAAALDQDFIKARKIHYQLYNLMRDVFIDSNPIPIKAALAMMELIEEEYRLPMCKLNDTNREQLIASIKGAGIILP